MAYKWTFTTIGGNTRVHIAKGEDFRHLGELDEKMWTVLSCPTTGLEISESISGVPSEERKMNSLRSQLRYYVKVNAESTSDENVYLIRSGDENLLKVYLDRDKNGSKKQMLLVLFLNLVIMVELMLEVILL